MTKQKFNSLRDKQDLSDLHYSSTLKSSFWNNKLSLGKYTDDEGMNYDLAVKFLPDTLHFYSKFETFIVFQDYINDNISYFYFGICTESIYNWFKEKLPFRKHYIESWERLQKLLTK